jgi:hypothetical protein
VTRLAERSDICSLARHVGNQMLLHYSHIRSQAKQAAIRSIEELAVEPVLPEHGQRNGQSEWKADDAASTNKWWARQDSNLGPTDYESAALTAELRARRALML